MYNKIEEQLGRPLNVLEIELLDDLIQNHSIDEIIDCFKQYPNKPLKYIVQVLKNKPKKQKNTWLDIEIINEPLDEKTKKEFEEFNKFIEEFRK